MITLGNGDKLMSLSEVLDRVREYLSADEDVQRGDVEKYGFEINMLAVALNESADYVRGAIRPRKQ